MLTTMLLLMACRYIHRVGRTARAGRSGRSITLVGEKGRAVLRAVMKSHEEANTSQDGTSKLARSSVMKSRQVPSSVVSRWQARIDGVEKDLSAIMKDESLEKRLQQVCLEIPTLWPSVEVLRSVFANYLRWICLVSDWNAFIFNKVEMEAQRASNLLVHAEEIKSRPRRTWFQSGAEKQRAAEADSGDGVGFQTKPLKASRCVPCWWLVAACNFRNDVHFVLVVKVIESCRVLYAHSTPSTKQPKTNRARSGGDGGEDSGDDTPRRAYRDGKQKAGAKRGTVGSSSSGAASRKKKKARWETGRNGKVGKEKRANNPTNY